MRRQSTAKLLLGAAAAAACLPASSIRLFAAFRKLEPETRAEMNRLLGGLFTSGASEAARAILPATFRRLVDPSASLAGRLHGRQSRF